MSANHRNPLASEAPAPIDREAFKRFEQAGWVQVADQYDAEFGALTRQAVPHLIQAAELRRNARVLDVACGPGHIAAAAVERGAQVMGVDFSSSMVGEAGRLHPQIEFREGDAERLTFGDGEFDAVVNGFGMLHLAYPERAAAEAFRVLRPGGRFVFSVWDAPERAISFGLVRGAIEKHGRLDVPLPPGPDFFRFSDAAACRALLEGVGFSAPRVESIALTWRMRDADAIIDAFLKGGVRTRGVLLAQTPEELARIRQGLRETTEPYRRGDMLELPTPCVIAAAVRP